ncbi:hypothetical protein [Alicyclobacillus fodiniaquatilis]|uniref:Uncharacterized protein n=1 Tax=Alicyclobacillus fodiniaquatilis TaxID=1661150 RepID=A0ABW4JJM0_9BACL
MREDQRVQEPRPLSRREHQQVLAQKRKRRQKRRKARLRKLRFYRSLRNLRFWFRAVIVLFIGLCIAFWARFAFVYDIPQYAMDRLPSQVVCYVTVKPWWFGPPVFDIGHYATQDPSIPTSYQPYQMLLMNLGKYQSILEHPEFIWTLRG